MAEVAELVTLAELEAQRMAAIARQAKAGDSIAMEVEQFNKLSEIIMGLCRMHAETDEFALGSPKYWVPLQVFQKLRDEYQAVKRSSRSLNDDFVLGL